MAEHMCAEYKNRKRAQKQRVVKKRIKRRSKI